MERRGLTTGQCEPVSEASHRIKKGKGKEVWEGPQRLIPASSRLDVAAAADVARPPVQARCHRLKVLGNSIMFPNVSLGERRITRQF